MCNRCPIILCIALLLVAGFSGNAPAFEPAVREAASLLRSGDADKALATLKEAQVDYPDAPELRFGIACATFAKGDGLLQTGAQKEGLAALTEAQSLFFDLTQRPEPHIAREATHNHTAVIAREALLLVEGGDYTGGVAALRRAVSALESAYERYPEHEGIRQNLEHIQFKLKELLQNPPPQEEQPSEQPPQEQPQGVMSRFGHAATELPGARTQVEENTAILMPPDEEEPQP